MSEFFVTVDTGICGYSFVKLVNASNGDKAKEIALEETENDIRYMLSNRKVVNVTTEWNNFFMERRMYYVNKSKCDV